MSTGTHPNQEDLIAYSLGALDPAEESAVALHVEECEVCAQEVAAYGPAVGALGEAVEQVAPPAELRERLLATVYEEAPPGFQPAPRRRSRSGFLSILLRPATGLAVVAVAIAAAGGFLAAGDSDEPARTVAISNAAGNADGELVIESGKSTLNMTGMPQLKQGAVYQVWVADPDGKVTPSATFLPHEDGTATAAIPEAGDDVKQVMVTAEPGPNRTDPTLPAVLDVSLD